MGNVLGRLLTGVLFLGVIGVIGWGVVSIIEWAASGSTVASIAKSLLVALIFVVGAVSATKGDE